MANRPRVRLTTGRVPSQSLHLFKTCCTNFLQDFHSKPIFHRAERKEVEGCFLRPLCDMFWHRLHGNPDLVIFLIETSIKWRAKGNFYGSILLRYFYWDKDQEILQNVSEEISTMSQIEFRSVKAATKGKYYLAKIILIKFTQIQFILSLKSAVLWFYSSLLSTV